MISGKQPFYRAAMFCKLANLIFFPVFGPTECYMYFSPETRAVAIVVDSSSEESTDMTVDCRLLPVNTSIEHHLILAILRQE